MLMDRSTVVGVFRDRLAAERAIDDLHRAGFGDDEIGFAVRGAEGDVITGMGPRATDMDSKASEGAVGGMLAGAGIGGLIAAGVATLIPGFGPVLAGGVLATVLGGAAVGATAGGILGALAGVGVPEDEARYYEAEFHEGRILVIVKTDDRYMEARDVLRRAEDRDIESRGGQAAA